MLLDCLTVNQCTHTHRYTGHTNSAYPIDCAFSYSDAHVMCGSEKNDIHFWDLVEVSGRVSQATHSLLLVVLGILSLSTRCPTTTTMTGQGGASPAWPQSCSVQRGVPQRQPHHALCFLRRHCASVEPIETGTLQCLQTQITNNQQYLQRRAITYYLHLVMNTASRLRHNTHNKRQLMYTCIAH